MPKIERLNAFDQKGLTTINEFVDIHNAGYSDEDIKTGARIQTSKLRTYIKEGITVTTTQKAVPHFLGVTPVRLDITPASSGNVYRSKASDSRNVYLTAASGTQTVDICVWG